MLSALSQLRHMWDILTAIAKLPHAQLQFDAALAPAEVSAAYDNFTRRHPRYRIIGNKTIGAALVDIEQFATPAHYRASIAERNWGGYFARRAQARGYRFASIERNRYADDIHAINQSMPERQGRPMAASYQDRTAHYTDRAHYRYYGVLDKSGKLMAYCELGTYGNFALFSRLLGYRNNDGIMHFMIVEIVSLLIAERRVRYAMYDTWFGASEGLRRFKTILGFKPYRVRYALLAAQRPQAASQATCAGSGLLELGRTAAAAHGQGGADRQHLKQGDTAEHPRRVAAIHQGAEQERAERQATVEARIHDAEHAPGGVVRRRGADQ